MEERSVERIAIGVDFGATNIKALLVGMDGAKYGTYLRDTDLSQGPAGTLDRIVELVAQARQDARKLGKEVAALGIGVCAPVDYASGAVVESSVLPGWRNVPVAAPVQRATGLAVCLENDANAAILGEWWQGAGRRKGIVAGLTLGTGIGGGLVIAGRVYRGASGFAGEFGHIQVADGPPCACGNKGCLGRVASATATLERYRQLASPDSPPADGVAELAQLAERGNTPARQAIDASIGYLCRAAVILVNCFNPDVFILAGGMSRLGSAIIDPIRETVRTSTYSALGAATEIAAASLDMYSGCYGAAWLALSAVAPVSQMAVAP